MSKGIAHNRMISITKSHLLFDSKRIPNMSGENYAGGIDTNCNNFSENIAHLIQNT